MAGAPIGPFERIDLRQVPPGSALLEAAAPPGWRAQAVEDEPCLVSPLVGEDGLGSASLKCRANWRYAVRRIGREGGEVGLVAADETGAAMDELARLHALRWRDKGASGMLADPAAAGRGRARPPPARVTGVSMS